jgi:hypothetical protein
MTPPNRTAEQIAAELEAVATMWARGHCSEPILQLRAIHTVAACREAAALLRAGAERREPDLPVCRACGVRALHPDDECCRSCYATLKVSVPAPRTAPHIEKGESTLPAPRSDSNSADTRAETSGAPTRTAPHEREVAE